MRKKKRRREKMTHKEEIDILEDRIGVRECMLQSYHSRIAHWQDSIKKTEQALARDKKRLKEVIKLTGAEEAEWAGL
jgi:hypothetical protein